MLPLCNLCIPLVHSLSNNGFFAISSYHNRLDEVEVLIWVPLYHSFVSTAFSKFFKYDLHLEASLKKVGTSVDAASLAMGEPTPIPL